jgi:hypothetical protein
MTRGTALKSVIEYPLGTLGLLLIGLIAWATGRLERRALVDHILARLVLAFVSTIGWIVDRFPIAWSSRGSSAEADYRST